MLEMPGHERNSKLGGVQIEGFNPGPPGSPPEEDIVTRFRVKASEYPFGIASECGGDVLTFRELDSQSERLAKYLVKKYGVDGNVFGVLMGRSNLLLVTLLGILKAGAAYVPFDVGHPKKRTRYILRSNKISLLISTTKFGKHFENDEFDLLCLDISEDYVQAQCLEVELPKLTNSDLAYVMFTSGSTGVPKGVMISHGALSNYVFWAAETYTKGERNTFALFTSPAFDLTVTSIYVPLVTGGTIIIYPDLDQRGELAVLHVLEPGGAEILKLTPSHLSLLLGLDCEGAVVKQMILGGEDLKSSLAEAAIEKFGSSLEIHNEYGPTEATVGCMHYRYQSSDSSIGSVSLGVPVANTNVYLLDQDMKPCRVGELYVAGAGLAKGYYNEPTLTEESFLPNPFVENTLMYRTGDMARWRNGAQLEFLGRKDHQIKVGGVRVELSEVENAVLEHAGVKECVVTLYGSKDIETRTDSSSCVECGLASSVPGTQISGSGLCNRCLEYQKYAPEADKYFRSMDELEAMFMEEAQHNDNDFDCLMLMSGGKDSTYALGRLGEMGLRVLVFSLDNGYISEEAKSNIRRVTDTFGMKLVFGSTPAMNAVFVDSLQRFSNVCNGCFKVIYTLAMECALSHGIRYIVTGLSRGQIFDTRLKDFYSRGVCDPEEIDRQVIEARKAYHEAEDAVSCNMDVRFLEDGSLLDSIEIIDFYRYCDVGLDEVYNYLERRLPWVRPSDTGRSTNCLINEVGIYIHKRERGYHNYASPYSWDVRLGHKSRDAALAELDDEIDEENVERILQEIGYSADNHKKTRGPRLAAYYVSEGDLDPQCLRNHLIESLPYYMVPESLNELKTFPLTVNGKIDREALPIPSFDTVREHEYVPPRNEVERQLIGMWEEIFGVEDIGVHDDFFSLGGHSLLALRLSSRISERLDIRLSLAEVLRASNVAELALLVEKGKTNPRLDDSLSFVRTERPDRIPLSFAQEQLWVLDQLRPGMTAYNLAIRIDIEGLVEERLLRAAICSVVKRHEVLRTSFLHSAGKPSMLVRDEVEIPLERCSLLDVSVDKHSTHLDAMAKALEGERFDLARGPLLRLVLVELGPTDFCLLVVVHHIVFDGWSISVLVEEISEAYDNYATKGEDIRVSLDTQYADYAIWQRGHAVGARLEAQLSYWRRQLSAPLSVLDIPTDFNRPKVQCWTGEVARSNIGEEIYSGVVALSQRCQVTPFVVLLACWKLLLSRYSGAEDVVSGTALAGRDRGGVDSLIGFFVNTVALRTQVAPDLSFESLLKRVDTAVLDALANQDVPFSSVVSAVEHKRDLSRSPLFQHMFVLNNTPNCRADGVHLVMQAEEVTATSAKFDLVLAAQPRDKGLSLRMEYSTALFKRETVDRMLRHFAALLVTVVESPELPIGLLGRLYGDEVERHSSILAVSDDEAGGSEGIPCLHEVFERVADEYPDAPAITCEGITLKYQELNGRANRLAHHLRDLGVATDVLVGLCVDRSVDTVVGILAVLKAGGAYVPMDPAYPAERVRMIVEDAACPVVLVHRAHEARFKQECVCLVVLDSAEAPWKQYPDSNPGSATTRDSLAYVIYTSGSTGLPKGALVTHENVRRLVTEMGPWFDIGSSDVWTLFHSYAFDFSVWEIWGAFFHGGRLVVVPYSTSRSPKAFYELLLAERVTVLNQTPSAFRQLQSFDESVSMEISRGLALRYIIFGGEVLDLPSLGPWFARHGDQQPSLINMYGITETTVFVTYRPVTIADTVPGTPSFIGIPIPDLHVHVLDERQNPVRTGEVGELYVGGAGVCKGYFNRPELTAERFVPDLIGNGGTLYKTGDLVRLLDGDLEFIGRNDTQVQLRGFRVELGEIETLLNGYSDVRGVVVRMREDLPGDQRLIAYYLSSEAIEESLLRQYLAHTLPSYMIPSTFLHMESFPINSNGKLDVAALSLPLVDRDDSAIVDAASETEETIVGIWGRLLRRKSIGVSEDFFEMGGHSLLAIQMAAEIESTFGTLVNLEEFFVQPTIRALADSLSLKPGTNGRRNSSTRALFKLKGGTKTPLYFVMGAGVLRHPYELLANELAPDQPFYSFDDLELDLSNPEACAVTAVAKRCVEEIRSEQSRGPYILGGYSFGGLVAYEMAQQLIAAGEDVPAVILLDTSTDAGKKEQIRRGLKGLPDIWTRIRIVATKLVTTWPMQVGYARDGSLLLLKRAFRPGPNRAGNLSLMDYLRWMWLDTSAQFHLIQAGLIKATISERRLEMVEESLIRRSAGSMNLARQACQDYALQPIATRVVLLRATEDLWQKAKKDPTLGWENYALGGVDVSVAPGCHIVMIRHPYVKELGQILQERLSELDAKKKTENLLL